MLQFANTTCQHKKDSGGTGSFAVVEGHDPYLENALSTGKIIEQVTGFSRNASKTAGDAVWVRSGEIT